MQCNLRKHQQTEKTQQKHTNPSVIPKVWAGAPDEPWRYCRWAAVVTEIQFEITQFEIVTYI